MKNIHVLPTDEPSRLFEILQFNFVFDNQNKYSEEYKKLHKYKNKNIYITNSEKPKAGEYSLYQNKIHKCIEDIIGDEFKKIILTTDPDLIKDGVQSIDDKFLEWFVKNPSCEEVEVNPLLSNNGRALFGYKIIIPKEEPKQETLEEAAEKEFPLVDTKWCRTGAEKLLYSEEEVFALCRDFAIFVQQKRPSYKKQLEWFEQYKKK
jgi:hypothetical protein